MQVQFFGTHFLKPTNSKYLKLFSIVWSFPVVEPRKGVLCFCLLVFLLFLQISKCFNPISVWPCAQAADVQASTVVVTGRRT